MRTMEGRAAGASLAAPAGAPVPLLAAGVRATGVLVLAAPLARGASDGASGGRANPTDRRNIAGSQLHRVSTTMDHDRAADDHPRGSRGATEAGAGEAGRQGTPGDAKTAGGGTPAVAARVTPTEVIEAITKMNALASYFVDEHAGALMGRHVVICSPVGDTDNLPVDWGIRSAHVREPTGTSVEQSRRPFTLREYELTAGVSLSAPGSLVNSCIFFMHQLPLGGLRGTEEEMEESMRQLPYNPVASAAVGREARGVVVFGVFLHINEPGNMHVLLSNAYDLRSTLIQYIDNKLLLINSTTVNSSWLCWDALSGAEEPVAAAAAEAEEPVAAAAEAEEPVAAAAEPVAGAGAPTATAPEAAEASTEVDGGTTASGEGTVEPEHRTPYTGLQCVLVPRDDRKPMVNLCVTFCLNGSDDAPPDCMVASGNAIKLDPGQYEHMLGTRRADRAAVDRMGPWWVLPVNWENLNGLVSPHVGADTPGDVWLWGRFALVQPEGVVGGGGDGDADGAGSSVAPVVGQSRKYDVSLSLSADEWGVHDATHCVVTALVNGPAQRVFVREDGLTGHSKAHQAVNHRATRLVCPKAGAQTNPVCGDAVLILLAHNPSRRQCIARHFTTDQYHVLASILVSPLGMVSATGEGVQQTQVDAAAAAPRVLDGSAKDGSAAGGAPAGPSRGDAGVATGQAPITVSGGLPMTLSEADSLVNSIRTTYDHQWGSSGHDDPAAPAPVSEGTPPTGTTTDTTTPDQLAKFMATVRANIDKARGE